MLILPGLPIFDHVLEKVIIRFSVEQFMADCFFT